MITIKHLFPVILFVMFELSTANCTASNLFDSNKTSVLVLGTVHQRHSSDTNYTYTDVFDIISIYNPDIICVEIRPQDFRKVPYLNEMMLATIWGLNNGRKAYPIDWWMDGERQAMDSLMKLPEYKQKEKIFESLEGKNSIIQNFEKKYGKWQDQVQQGYEFWNGKEYNEYWAEDYRLSMEVFGDSPINLSYRTRNDSMMVAILNVVHKYPGQKIMVLTGAEHKHYFDRALLTESTVSLIPFESLKPIEHQNMDAAVKLYLEDLNDLSYYQEGYPQDMNDYYSNKLVPVIHGPDMDEFPEYVSKSNIIKAEKVISRWKQDPNSDKARDMIDFELGWVLFLKGEFREAITVLQPLCRKIQDGNITDKFIIAMTYRNLGFCYDCIGERENAIANYKTGEARVQGTFLAGFFKNYKDVPYHAAHH